MRGSDCTYRLSFLVRDICLRQHDFVFCFDLRTIFITIIMSRFSLFDKSMIRVI